MEVLAPAPDCRRGFVTTNTTGTDRLEVKFTRGRTANFKLEELRCIMAAKSRAPLLQNSDINLLVGQSAYEVRYWGGSNPGTSRQVIYIDRKDTEHIWTKRADTSDQPHMYKIALMSGVLGLGRDRENKIREGFIV